VGDGSKSGSNMFKEIDLVSVGLNCMCADCAIYDHISGDFQA